MTAAAVVVVDDGPAARDLLAQMVTSHDDRVRSAGEGEAAMPENARETRDLLVLDLMIPDTDGAAERTAVWAELGTWNLPVFVVTAQHNGPEDLAQPGRHTADHLPKTGLSTDTLLAKV